MLAGTGDPEAAARALTAHAREVVVTLGAEGALWTDGDAVVRAPARRGRRAVDTTGAGDAFAAGLLAARLARRRAGGGARRGLRAGGRGRRAPRGALS